MSRVNCGRITGDRVIDQDNLRLKFSALNVECKFRPPRLKKSSVRMHYIWVPLQSVIFSRFQPATNEFSPKLLETRQPAYEITLMLSRVSWALAHISC